MTLEISEIGVRIAVGGPAKAPAPGEAPATPDGPNTYVTLSAAQHEAIVNDCVQQVLKNLKQMQER